MSYIPAPECYKALKKQEVVTLGTIIGIEMIVILEKAANYFRKNQ